MLETHVVQDCIAFQRSFWGEIISYIVIIKKIKTFDISLI